MCVRGRSASAGPGSAAAGRAAGVRVDAVRLPGRHAGAAHWAELLAGGAARPRAGRRAHVHLRLLHADHPAAGLHHRVLLAGVHRHGVQRAAGAVQEEEAHGQPLRPTGPRRSSHSSQPSSSSPPSSTQSTARAHSPRQWSLSSRSAQHSTAQPLPPYGRCVSAVRSRAVTADRHRVPRATVLCVQLGANIAQINNIRFFYTELQLSAAQRCSPADPARTAQHRPALWLTERVGALAGTDREFVGAEFWQGPHIKFAVTVTLLAAVRDSGQQGHSHSRCTTAPLTVRPVCAAPSPGLRCCALCDGWQLAYVGWVSVPVYWFCFICLSYRWNAHHLLYTILNKYVDSDDVRRGSDTDAASAHRRRRTAPLRRLPPSLPLRCAVSGTRTATVASTWTFCCGWPRWPSSMASGWARAMRAGRTPRCRWCSRDTC